MDGAGNAYVAEAGQIRKITPGGVVSTLATCFLTLVGIAVGPDGNLVAGDNSKNQVFRVNAATGAKTLLAGTGAAGDLDAPAASATFAQIQNVAAGADGSVYVAQYNGTIRRISAGGDVTTLAGAPGTSGYVDAKGAAARFLNPAGLAVDAQGNVLVGEWFGSAIRKIAPDGTVTTWCGGSGSAFLDGPAATARFDRPIRLAVDAGGTVYVCDLYNQAVRKVAPNGTVTTLVGGPSLRGTRPGALPASIYFPYGNGVRANGDLLVASESAIMAITAP
jgi:sugar lactone lactonase YvrE